MEEGNWYGLYFRCFAAGIADVKVVNPAAGLRLSAAIVEVSRSGLQIEVDKPLNSGSGVEIRLNESVVTGRMAPAATGPAFR